MRQPDYKMVQGGNYQVHQNPNVAGSVGKGLARMGQDMQRSGMQIAGALDKLAKSEEDREAINYQQEWENAYSEHKKTMLSTQHSPLEWQSKWDDISAKLRQGYENKSMSVRQRNRLGETFTRWNGEVSRSIGWNAHKTSYSNTRDTYTARAYNQAQDNNYDGSLETLSQAYQNGYMSQAEFEKGVGEIERKKKEYDIREEIAINPWDADLEKFNLNTQQKERWDGELKRSQSAKRREIGHDIVNGVISGDIDSEEKLREAASRMDEKSVFDLVKFYNGFHDDKVRKHMASPEQQNILVGKMKAMIAGYKPNGQEFDQQYVTLQAQLSYLNDGALKKELGNQINAIRDGKEIEIKSVKEWGSKKITAHGKNLLDKIAKPETRQTKLLEYLNDGFFNEENLSVYFNEDDVENILNAKEKAGDIIGADNVSTYSARIKMFKKLWARRENVGNTEWEQRMANAIVAGGLNTVIREWDDPEDGAEYDAKVEAHEERLGRMHDEYQDFLKSHPDPQEKDIKDFLIDLEVDMDAEGMGSFIKPRPGTKTSYNVKPRTGKYGSYQVIHATRDKLGNMTSVPGNRLLSTDFNDADRKSARGIEVKVPNDVTSAEITHVQNFSSQAQKFFAKHGHKVPLRGNMGVKKGGRGQRGFFHIEPFFIADEKSRKIIEKNPKEWAKIMGSTMGKIAGAKFIIPHKTKDPGATGADGTNERDWSAKYQIPNL